MALSSHKLIQLEENVRRINLSKDDVNLSKDHIKIPSTFSTCDTGVSKFPRFSPDSTYASPLNKQIKSDLFNSSSKFERSMQNCSSNHLVNESIRNLFKLTNKQLFK